MGLLSNPKTREKIVSVIASHNNKLAFVCYVAGVAYFLALAYRPLNAGVYMSENALIPGLVESDFYDDNGAGDFFLEYKNNYKRLKEEIEAIPQSKRDDSVLYDLPSTWLVSQFKALGLETYVHNYTFRYPASILKDQVMTGQNMYAILRAPRAAGTEALVLSVPFRPPGTEQEKTAAGLAVLLGVAKGFRRRTYWAKDIIFLVTDNDEIGMQAWLAAYHHAPYQSMQYITPGELHGRSGSIQAAINLEIGTDTISRMNVKIEGLNGQLPNLDLVNTVNRLCKKEGILTTLHKRPDSSAALSYAGWEHSARTMLAMMWTQASGAPSGNHGLFHRYRIEAVTLQGVKMKSGKKTAGFEQMGRVVEGIFRSLNNLLERFHQSFFFYLLPSTDRYISIGLYFPPFGLMAAPILIKAVAMWIAYSFESNEPEEEKEKTQEKATDDETEGETDDDGKKSKKEIKNDTGEEMAKVEKDDALVLPATAGFSAVVPQLIMAAVFALGTYHAPGFFVSSASVLRMGPGEGLMIGAIAVQFSAMGYPYMIKRKAKQKNLKADEVDWKLLKCLGLLGFGVVIFAVALMNISLAFFITLVSTPVVVAVRPTHSRLGNLVQYLAMFLISPLAALLLVGLVNHVMTSPPVTMDNLAEVFQGAYSGAQTALLYSVVDSHLYNNWTYSLATLALWPIWLIFWSVLWTQPS